MKTARLARTECESSQSRVVTASAASPDARSATIPPVLYGKQECTRQLLCCGCPGLAEQPVVRARQLGHGAGDHVWRQATDRVDDRETDAQLDEVEGQRPADRLDADLPADSGRKQRR